VTKTAKVNSTTSIFVHTMGVILCVLSITLYCCLCISGMVAMGLGMKLTLAVSWKG